MEAERDIVARRNTASRLANEMAVHSCTTAEQADHLAETLAVSAIGRGKIHEFVHHIEADADRRSGGASSSCA